MKIVIIGGGAAGFMAAITAAETNPRADITIYEKQPKVLGKVRISGGGRCNVTHHQPEVTEFAKQYPRGQHFIRKLMLEFGQTHTIAWFAQRGVQLKAEADGRMFPVSDTSQTIIDCLCTEAARLGVHVHTGLGVSAFEVSGGGGFRITLTNGHHTDCDRLLVATGGKPKLEDYAWLSRCHQIIAPKPSLFTFNAPGHHLLPLMGVSVSDAEVKVVECKEKWRGPVLITHWGFSGPAVLKLSAICARELADLNYQCTVHINWIPEYHEQACRDMLMRLKQTDARKLVQSHPQCNLPARLWVALCLKANIGADLRWADAGKSHINELTLLLTQSTVAVRGKTTFKEEFVTAGGVALTEVYPRTLESKHIQGLYFAGEVLDVDGITGGFNFQNAWTTGYMAGKAIAEHRTNN